MIIANSTIQLVSSRTDVERYSRTENLTVWQGDRKPKDIRVGRPTPKRSL